MLDFLEHLLTEMFSSFLSASIAASQSQHAKNISWFSFGDIILSESYLKVSWFMSKDSEKLF